MKKKATKAPAAKLIKATAPKMPDTSFGEILHLIQAAKQRAYQAVNTELVSLYWQVGEYISRKLDSAEWGDKVVDELARFLASTQPGLLGFTRRNLFRMRQFYDAYRTNELVSPLVTQLPWTHHLIILSRSKREEEREFYIRLPAFAFRVLGEDLGFRGLQHAVEAAKDGHGEHHALVLRGAVGSAEKIGDLPNEVGVVVVGCHGMAGG